MSPTGNHSQPEFAPEQEPLWPETAQEYGARVAKKRQQTSDRLDREIKGPPTADGY